MFATELSLLSERPDGAGTPVSVGGASYSAAHEAEVALFANRSVAEVLELVRSAVEGAVHNELASQAETRPGGGTPASVGGGSHSAAHDADVALLAQRSVQEVLHAVAQQSETPEVPVAPERSLEPQPEHRSSMRTRKRILLPARL
eukprot:g18465.t1